MMFLIKNILMVDNGIDIVIFMKHNKDMEIQTYYTDAVEKNASEDDSVKTFSVGSKDDEYRKIKLNLKTKSIKKLRIDFDTFPGEFSIQKIEVNGKKKVTVTPDDISKAFFSQIEIKEKADKYIVLDGKGSDPFLVLIEENGLNESRRSFDILQTFSFFILLYFIVYKLLLYLKIKKFKAEWKTVIYIFLVYLIFIFPVLKIDNEKMDKIEYRVLAKSPKLMQNKELNLNYGKEVEDWLNDHFYKRKKFLKFYQEINKFITGNVKNEKAVSGKENWLFFNYDESVKNFQNINLFSQEELQGIRENLLERKKFLDKYEIKYYIFLSPDKNKVYEEYYINGIFQINESGRIKQLQDFLKEDNITIIYPDNELKNGKQSGMVYWKNDSHWNFYGAFIGYEALMRAIQKDFLNIESKILEDYQVNQKTFPDGDLQRMMSLDEKYYLYDNYKILTPQLGYKFIFSEIDNIKKEIDPNKDFNFYKLITKHFITKSSKPLKVLVLGDSFSAIMVPYISDTFGEVEYIYTYDFNEFKEKIITEKPDIVIQQMLELHIMRLGG